MKVTKRILMTLLTLVAFTGAWAIEQDTDGYYLIGTVQDWKDFAALVQSIPAINARMTADVDLGDDQTVIGSPRNGGNLWYQGTFDGEGHTLTIAYNNTSGELFTTPFSLIQGATIKNLHLDGTVNTVYAYGGSVASIGRGSNTLKNIWNSVTSVCTMGGWIQMGALFGVLDSGASMDVSDCLFTGSMSHNGAYSGYFTGCYGPGPKVSNCLVLGEFTGGYGFNGSFTNCYLKHASTEGVTIPTDEQLADGTIATALGDAWVQDPVTNQPILKLFVSLKQDADGYYEIGSVKDWQNFAKLVEKTPNVNARMTADIDLGEDQTMIGNTSSTPYRGTFDGQGHTLTVNINATGKYVAVFRYVDGATIQGVHVAGSLHSDEVGLGGLVGSGPNTTVRQCWVSAYLITDKIGGGERHSIGGVFSEPGESGLMEDCLFDGTIADQNNHFCGGFSNYSPKAVTIKNSLNLGTFPVADSYYSSETATFIRTDAGAGGSHVLENLFYLNSFGVPQGTQVTVETLADKSVTTSLNADRTGDEAPWVQQGSQPMLKIFVPDSGISTGIDNGQRSKGFGQRDGWYTIDGRKLSGKPAKKGIYINNGKKAIID
ncbi:MAG: hypothetical protein J6T43_08680 [Prevotella sp.]|nr:hypothetical protein [Prevotella sp.]